MDESLRLLLLEPHDDTRRLLARLLRERGFNIAAAPSSDAALAVAASRSVDLAVIDTALPDVELPNLLRRLRFLCNDVPMIATTTAVAEGLSRLNAMPFHRVLLKPYGLEALLGAVSSATRGRVACTCA